MRTSLRVILAVVGVFAGVRLSAQITIIAGQPTRESAVRNKQVVNENLIRYEGDLPKSCGEAKRDTPCDQSCFLIGTKELHVVAGAAPTCGRWCIDLPAGRQVEKFDVWVRTEKTGLSRCPLPGESPDQDCQAPNGWTAVERTEVWKAGKACVVLKNWSADKSRIVRVDVTLKPLPTAQHK